MSLTNQVSEDLKLALKAKELEKVKILRYLISQLKYAAIDTQKNDLTDEEAQKTISSLVKKTKESREMFLKANREDMIKEADFELMTLAHYLPSQLSTDELEKEVRQILDQAPPNLSIGALTGFCIKKLAGKAENAQIAQIIQKISQE